MFSSHHHIMITNLIMDLLFNFNFVGFAFGSIFWGPSWFWTWSRHIFKSKTKEIRIIDQKVEIFSISPLFHVKNIKHTTCQLGMKCSNTAVNYYSCKFNISGLISRIILGFISRWQKKNQSDFQLDFTHALWFKNL